MSISPVFADLALLLGQRARAARNAVRFAPRVHRLVGGALGLGGLALFAGIFAAFFVLLLGAREAGNVLLVHALVGRTFLFLFLFLLAGAVPFVSGTLFAPGDLPLLLASPARPGAVVIARLLDAVWVSSAQFIVIGLPLLFASAGALGLAWWGWLVFGLLVALFLLLPALLTAVLLLVLARAAGLRRVRAAVALLSALLAVGMCLLLVSEFAGQTNRIGATGLRAVTVALSGSAAGLDVPPAPPYLPSAWATDALIALASPRPANALAPLGLLLGTTLACGALAAWLGRRVLLGETLLEGEGGTGAAGKTGESAFERLLQRWGLSPAVRALVVKDVRYVGRDLVLLSQIGVPVILYLVPFVIAGQLRRGGAGIGGTELWALSAGLVGVIAYMETSILGLSSIGLEGRGFWTVLHAPVGAEAFVRAKFVVAFGASLLLCVPLLLFSSLVFGIGAGTTLVAAGVLVFACAALCGLSVGIAGLFPRFVYDNPAHRASLAALVWGFVGATLYVVLAGLTIGGGAWLAFQQAEKSALVRAGTSALFVLLSILTAVVPLLLARSRLDGYAWEL